jgi:hypothetical protein
VSTPEERVANGSKRKRDLRAVGSGDPAFDARAFAANQLPEERYGYAVLAAGRCWVRQPKGRRKLPTPDEVRAELRRVGKDRESLGDMA